MFEGKAILLSESEVTIYADGTVSPAPEVRLACAYAQFVIFRGYLITNRYGDIPRINAHGTEQALADISTQLEKIKATVDAISRTADTSLPFGINAADLSLLDRRALSESELAQPTPTQP